MSTNALARLLEASRPYKEFTFESESGDKITMFARRMGQVDIETAARAWEDAYRAAKAEFKDSEMEQTAVFEGLNRSSKERLAKFIANAEKLDYLAEGSSLLDQPTDSEEVKEFADNQVSERITELKDQEHTALVQLAYERRWHTYASNVANSEQIRSMAKATIYERMDSGEFVPVFSDPKMVADLPQSSLVKVLEAARLALEPPEEVPEVPPLS